MKKANFKLGTRVGVIFDTNDNGEVYFLGYGIYDGDVMPQKETGIEIPTPKVTLDSGEVVWGNEFAWCGTEEAVRNFLKDRIITNITVTEIRANKPQSTGADTTDVSTSGVNGTKVGMKLFEFAMEGYLEVYKLTGSSNAAVNYMLNVITQFATVSLTQMFAKSDDEMDELYIKIRDHVAKMVELVVNDIAPDIKLKTIDSNKNGAGKMPSIILPH